MVYSSALSERTLSASPWRSGAIGGRRRLPVVLGDEGGGDVGQLGVDVLGLGAKRVERFDGGDAVGGYGDATSGSVVVSEVLAGGETVPGAVLGQQVQ